ncbi:MAG: hypothetical protein AVDCRST_MAG50-2232 [uncultured Acidimicrobiales bacterium]|uniref:Energy-coupling factor transporter transmembrane protein EcfT n=1 Tax=uncultured Acidimicrobiales bacterium TaxID=310071 RepID=A0A6J4IFU8_9ACTN|nr:MAG: hypothetical protein AVDCRST_MAG50-2232 [uncultured Acidimicrobiales bacterium]
MDARQPLHALTWLVWALAAAASVQLAPNPLYVALVLAISAAVVATNALDSPLAKGFPLLVGLGLTFALVRVVLTVATTHGVGDVLFSLPSARLPQILGGFTVGGTVEVPVLLQSASEGLVIVGVLAAFAAFNAVVSHHELVRSAPAAFFELGLVLTVSLAFVPVTLQAIGAVREADKARTGGRIVRRGRLVRQAVPLLETGMERAVSLAESMDSRGFGHQAPTRHEAVGGWLGVGALLSLAGTFLALVGGAPPVSAALLVALGAGLFAAAVALTSAGRRRVRYRPRHLVLTDWLVLSAAIAAPATLAMLSVLHDDTLRWSVSPLALPSVSAPAVVALLALALPAFLRPPNGVAPR